MDAVLEYHECFASFPKTREEASPPNSEDCDETKNEIEKWGYSWKWRGASTPSIDGGSSTSMSSSRNNRISGGESAGSSRTPTSKDIVGSNSWSQFLLGFQSMLSSDGDETVFDAKKSANRRFREFLYVFPFLRDNVGFLYWLSLQHQTSGAGPDGPDFGNPVNSRRVYWGEALVVMADMCTRGLGSSEIMSMSLYN